MPGIDVHSGTIGAVRVQPLIQRCNVICGDAFTPKTAVYYDVDNQTTTVVPSIAASASVDE